MQPRPDNDWICKAILSSDDGIFIVDHHGIISFWNQGAKNIFLLGAHEVLGKNLSALQAESLTSGDDLLSIYLEAIKKKRSIEVVSILQTAQISHLTLSINATPVIMHENDPNGSSCVFVFKDITFLKNHEKELEKDLNALEGYVSKLKGTQMVNMKLMKEIVAKKREIKKGNATLKDLNLSILDALQNISHEILSPLANIIGFSEYIKTEESLKKKTLNDHLDRIISAAQRIEKMANRILDASKLESEIESGSVTLAFEVVDINSVITNVFQEQKYFMAKKKLKAQMELEQHSLNLEADRGMLFQLLTNLVSNAIKYTPEGGEITFRSRDEREKVGVRIMDTGRGIPEKEIPRIFDRFHRVPETEGNQIMGIGIGLNLVKSITNLHNGEIRVRSRLGEGSTFDILLPKTQAKKEPEQ